MAAMVKEQGFVEVPGGRLWFEVEGAGPPLLLIHGGLGSLRMWDGQVPAWARHFTVIRYDTRGFGLSETDDVQFSNRADAVAVLDRLGHRTAHVVGQSRGGNIALDLAIEQPAVVRSLVLVAAGAGGLEGELPEGTSQPPWDEMQQLWEARQWADLAELETRVWVDGWGQPRERVAPELREQVRGWILATYEAEKTEAQPQPLDPPASGRLDEVKAPVLIIVGTADEPGAVANARATAAGLPNARLVELDGVAHMVQLEAPERIAELVLKFVQGVDR